MAAIQGWEKALELLGPLDARLDAALAAGDMQLALRLAFEGAAAAAGVLAEPSDLPTLHQVYVELTPLPLVTLDDGTLAEHRAYVTFAYQSRRVADDEAKRLACAWSRQAGWTVDSP